MNRSAVAPDRVTPSSFPQVAESFDLVVLDVHGVVFNKPLHGFLVDVGERSGEGSQALLERWRRDLRVPFWEGALAEAEMWSRLAPGLDPELMRLDLESRFAPGPLFDPLARSTQRAWLLSNHRSDWLSARLERFGLDGRFERVLVSDRIGAAKPTPRAFDELAGLARHTAVWFVDDQLVNVDGARALGVHARLLTPDPTDHPCNNT